MPAVRELRFVLLSACRAFPRASIVTVGFPTAPVFVDKFSGASDRVLVDYPHGGQGLCRHRHLAPHSEQRLPPHYGFDPVRLKESLYQMGI